MASNILIGIFFEVTFDSIRNNDMDIRSLEDDSATWRFTLFDLRQWVDRGKHLKEGIPDYIMEIIEEICVAQQDDMVLKPSFQYMIQELVIARLLTYFLSEPYDVDGFEREYYRLFKATSSERLRMISILTPEVRKEIKIDLEPLRHAYIDNTVDSISPSDLRKLFRKHYKMLGGAVTRMIDPMLAAVGPSILSEQNLARERAMQTFEDSDGSDMEDNMQNMDQENGAMLPPSADARGNWIPKNPASSSTAASRRASISTVNTPSKFISSPMRNYTTTMAGKTPGRPLKRPGLPASSPTPSTSRVSTTTRSSLRTPPTKIYETQAPMPASDSEEEREEVDESEKDPEVLIMTQQSSKSDKSSKRAASSQSRESRASTSKSVAAKSSSSATAVPASVPTAKQTSKATTGPRDFIDDMDPEEVAAAATSDDELTLSFNKKTAASSRSKRGAAASKQTSSSNPKTTASVTAQASEEHVSASQTTSALSAPSTSATVSEPTSRPRAEHIMDIEDRKSVV